MGVGGARSYALHKGPCGAIERKRLASLEVPRKAFPSSASRASDFHAHKAPLSRTRGVCLCRMSAGWKARARVSELRVLQFHQGRSTGQ